MNPVIAFDLSKYRKGWLVYIVAICFLIIGVFTGNQFNLSVGEGVYLNSPYTIGFMSGMLSLAVIFIATVFSNQLLFKEWDSHIDLIVFSTPISKFRFVYGRFLSFFVLTFLSFLLIIAGFALGQQLRAGAEIQPGMNVVHYLYPFIVFGLINTFFVCSVLALIAWSSRKKLLVAIGGLLLYVLYMVILVFSNSPFMAKSSPQSLASQSLSAVIDPFGISAYFFVSKDFTVAQRNSNLVPLSGYFLLNRLFITGLSFCFLFLAYSRFTFSLRKSIKRTSKRRELWETNVDEISLFVKTSQRFSVRQEVSAIGSFCKRDLIYIFKSISVVAASLLLLFCVGMEMYAEIEKGIRLPQKYASSGLMASTISENFHFIGLLITAYFVNDLYWRSKASGFSLIENTTFYIKSKLAGHWFAACILLLFFSVLLIVQGVLFQYCYHYTHIDWDAYAGVLVFNLLPLILFSAFLLLVNDRMHNRYLALGISILCTLIASGPLSQKLITYPLLRIFSGFTGVYSDFNGYGNYLPAFIYRLTFGAALLACCWILNAAFKTKFHWWKLVLCVALVFGGVAIGKQFLNGYIPGDKQGQIAAAVSYEQQYREYQTLPQPTITEVKTSIQLYPHNQSYIIEARYIVKNLTDKPIDSVLVNFNANLEIQRAVFRTATDSFPVKTTVSVLHLSKALRPNDTATLDFKLSYQWFAVNGHQSFNAIIDNGSFMRISRYYPQFGYQPDDEVQDKAIREKFKLGAATGIKQLNAPRTAINDFIQLDMTVSTTADQSAIGTGELAEQWQQGGRNYYHYKTNAPVPFRFAVSSAAYKEKSEVYKGIGIHVFYHPRHYENVSHLIDNIKLTLDYCAQNFGDYPFKSISFAEISSFTKGFAATAYPAVIFMPEDMVFHANIKADKEQDVVNELAGHELSHLWWGNNQISPDEREGAVMLTETLAMYTEMMLYKKMYGKEKMMQRLAVHRQLYAAEKGFSAEQPLYKVTSDNTHISYSKGAMVMVELSELIGEDQVNKALKNFLAQYKYPNAKPVSTDLINAFLQVSDVKDHARIKKLFME